MIRLTDMNIQKIRTIVLRGLVGLISVSFVTSCADTYPPGSGTYGGTSSSSDIATPLLIGATALGVLAYKNRDKSKYNSSKYKHYNHSNHYNRYNRYGNYSPNRYVKRGNAVRVNNNRYTNYGHRTKIQHCDNNCNIYPNRNSYKNYNSHNSHKRFNSNQRNHRNHGTKYYKKRGKHDRVVNARKPITRVGMGPRY